MVHIDGFVYLKAGQVTIHPIPVARIGVYNDAPPPLKARLIAIAIAVNEFNEMNYKKAVKH